MITGPAGVTGVVDTFRAKVCVTLARIASVTAKFTVYVPAAAGVPDRSPAFSDMPDGRVEAAVH